jgi:hypothetical protein
MPVKTPRLLFGDLSHERLPEEVKGAAFDAESKPDCGQKHEGIDLWHR